MQRRDILKTIGGIGATATAAGVGIGTMSGSAAASSLSIGSGEASVATAQGEIDRVSIQPNINVSWDGFDEVVGKVRVLIEAAPHDVENENVGDFAPVFRATGWLNGTDDPGTEVETGPGYSGEFAIAGEWLGGSDGITLYDRTGPDYSGVSQPENFFSGTSVAQDVPEDGFENGNYEQAGTVDRFFNPSDGTTENSEVQLRYTVSFHAPNSSIAADYDIPESDVSGSSPLVMAGADDVGSPITSYSADVIPYDVLQNNASGHPAILTTTSTFNVSVENESTSASGGGDSNTDASGSDEISATGDE
ncbi:hypothetical protein [Halorubrum saccharovorum]|uniref:hypothetical protein n=1 Tax=Halorubrum saccharovorum TaxID=2248 RepID=UPI00126848C6|nr:hypothetical protein [Halorubrum saccharovorum]